jgi:riboflavin kinase/FMN adenylyltransferase
LFDFDKNIYGETIKIEFIDRIRDEIKFNSMDELKIQLQEDKIKALKLLDK